MRKAAIYVAAISLAVIGVGLALVLSGVGGKRASVGPDSSGRANTSATAHIDAGQVETIGSELSSPDPVTFAQALDPQVAAGVAASGQRPLPEGSTVTIDRASATIVGSVATALATVTAAGGHASQWDLLFTLQNGRWALIAADPQ